MSLLAWGICLICLFLGTITSIPIILILEKFGIDLPDYKQYWIMFGLAFVYLIAFILWVLKDGIL